MTNIKELVERLLDRKLLKTEGVKPSEIDKIEITLGYSLPPSLKDLYLLAGKNTLLLESFNRFALPGQLQINDNKIVFLEENQEVCYWAFEINKENPTVYQLTANNEWFCEEIDLNTFLSTALYYNCAQGGYEFNGTVGINSEQLETLTQTEWEKVVEHNGLRIYWKPNCLLWYLFDKDNPVIDPIYFSALTQEAYNSHIEKYELEEIQLS